MNKEKFDYEKALKRLEAIVEQLENENTPLEKSIELFAEGKKLAELCLKKLTELEHKVRLLMETETGEIQTLDFPSTAENQMLSDEDTN